MLRGRSHARMIRSSGTGSGWLARKRSTRSVRVAAGTWLMAVLGVGVDPVGLAQGVLLARLLDVRADAGVPGAHLGALGLRAGQLGLGLGLLGLALRLGDDGGVGGGLGARSSSARARRCSALRLLASRTTAPMRRTAMTASTISRVSMFMGTPGVPVPGGARDVWGRP